MRLLQIYRRLIIDCSDYIYGIEYKSNFYFSFFDSDGENPALIFREIENIEFSARGCTIRTKKIDIIGYNKTIDKYISNHPNSGGYHIWYAGETYELRAACHLFSDYMIVVMPMSYYDWTSTAICRKCGNTYFGYNCVQIGWLYDHSEVCNIDYGYIDCVKAVGAFITTSLKKEYARRAEETKLLWRAHNS